MILRRTFPWRNSPSATRASRTKERDLRLCQAESLLDVLRDIVLGGDLPSCTHYQIRERKPVQRQAR